MNDTRFRNAIVMLVIVCLAIVIVILAALGLQVEQRNDAIDEIRSAAHRIEMAATHTEEVLIEVVEARDAPEAVAQSERVRDALTEIGQIKAILCDTVDHELCDN